MDVLIVGSGPMGRWLGRVFLEATDNSALPGPEQSCHVTYLDRQETVARDAVRETEGTNATARPSLADERFDVVCVAVPIPAATTALAEHAPRARRAVVDVTGTMAAPVEAMGEHAPEREHCSLHPLFAPANEPGNVPMVVESEGPVTAFLRNALEQRGNHVFETTPTEHDRYMQTVQARAHAAILTYGLAGERVPEEFQTTVSQELSALVEQVTGGNPRVYADIQAAFEGADDIATMAAELADADRETFESLYRRARFGDPQTSDEMEDGEENP